MGLELGVRVRNPHLVPGEGDEELPVLLVTFREVAQVRHLSDIQTDRAGHTNPTLTLTLTPNPMANPDRNSGASSAPVGHPDGQSRSPVTPL